MERIVIAILCSMLLFCTRLSANGLLANALLREEFRAGTITVNLLHRDHVLSTLGDTTNTTRSTADRMAEAVRRSHARRQRFGLLSPLTSYKTLPGKDSSPPDVAAQVNASSGEYVMTFSLGTPSVNFVTVMDTGSDLIWVQCKPCLACFPQSGSLLDPAKSATFKKLPCSNHFCKDLPQSNCTSAECPYLYAYGDGSSTSGLLASETTTLTTREGKVRSLKGLAFGCGSDNDGDFAGADGLVGFGRGPLSLPSQIGPFVGQEFSYCLGDFVRANNQSSTLVLGTDLEKDTSRLKFTPLISNSFFPTFYYIELKSIKVGNQTLKIHPDIFSIDSLGNGGTIVDSGTTLTYLPRAAYDELLSRLLKSVTYPVFPDSTVDTGLDLCFDISGIPVPELPVIAFHFQGVTLTLPTQNSFITFHLEPRTILSCLAMASASSSFGIFGNFQQQNFQVVYDLERSLLGFKEQTCL